MQRILEPGFLFMEDVMGLSCSCDYEYEFEPGEWTYWYEDTSGFIHLETSRRKRCCSCNDLIDIGSLCVKYPRLRYPYNEIEARIQTGGDLDDSLSEEPQIPIACHYHCEKCGEIYMNLTDIGYNCLAPCEDMNETLKEYHEITGFKINNDK